MNNSILTESDTDAVVLQTLLNVNKNALIFYRAGQKITHSQKVKNIYQKLEVVHSRCVDSIHEFENVSGETVKAFQQDSFEDSSVNLLSALKLITSVDPGEPLEKKLIRSKSHSLRVIHTALQVDSLSEKVSDLLEKQSTAIQLAHQDFLNPKAIAS